MQSPVRSGALLIITPHAARDLELCNSLPPLKDLNTICNYFTKQMMDIFHHQFKILSSGHDPINPRYYDVGLIAGRRPRQLINPV